PHVDVTTRSVVNLAANQGVAKMLRWLVIAGALASSSLSSMVMAQDVDIVTACGKAISGFNFTNSYELLTKSQQFSEYQSRLCSLKRDDFRSFSASAQTMGIDVPLAKGILGLDESQTQSSSVFRSRVDYFCTSTFSNYDRSDFFSLHTSNVSSSLAE